VNFRFEKTEIKIESIAGYRSFRDAFFVMLQRNGKKSCARQEAFGVNLQKTPPASSLFRKHTDRTSDTPAPGVLRTLGTLLDSDRTYGC